LLRLLLGLFLLPSSFLLSITCSMGGDILYTR
jgi:hypothetical protein